MSNKLYDVLKWIVMIVLPACATLCSTVAGIWGLPYSEQVVGTITASSAFLGTVLMISNVQYNRKFS